MLQNKAQASWYSMIMVHSHIQLCKSDQHSGIALIFAVFSQWHSWEYTGIEVCKLCEMTRIQVRVSFLLQDHQICETRFRRIGANGLVDIISVICMKMGGKKDSEWPFAKSVVLYGHISDTYHIWCTIYEACCHRHGTNEMVLLPSIRHLVLIRSSFWHNMASWCCLSVCSSSNIAAKNVANVTVDTLANGYWGSYWL